MNAALPTLLVLLLADAWLLALVCIRIQTCMTYSAWLDRQYERKPVA